MSGVRLVPPNPAFLGGMVETNLRRLEADVAIIGIPHGVAYPHASTTRGCADAPAAVRRRSARLGRFRDHHDFDTDGPMLSTTDGPRLVDCGDLAGAPDDGDDYAGLTRTAIHAILNAGAVPIALGGDDSIPIPVLHAFADAGPITVLQVDAHLDFRDEVAGVRNGYSSTMRRASEMRHVERIIQVGLRGVGSARYEDLRDAKAAGNLLVAAGELRSHGAEWLVEQLPARGSVFVSFDCDGFDPSVFPAVSAPSPGGLDYATVAELLTRIGRRCRLAGAAFTEYAPDLDVNEIGALIVARLVCLLAAGVEPRAASLPLEG